MQDFIIALIGAVASAAALLMWRQHKISKQQMKVQAAMERSKQKAEVAKAKIEAEKEVKLARIEAKTQPTVMSEEPSVLAKKCPELGMITAGKSDEELANQIISSFNPAIIAEYDWCKDPIEEAMRLLGIWEERRDGGNQ